LNIELLIEELHSQGWSIQEDFLGPSAVRKLRAECMQLYNADELQPAGVGRRQDHHVNLTIRKDKIHWLDGTTAAQQDYLLRMEQLRIAINQSLFLGLFEYEAHYAVYEPGAYYRKHRDQFSGQRTRVVTTVAYLNEDWRAESGGELALYDPENENTLLRLVTPQAGTFVCFLSERMPHEVLETHAQRASIAGWFRIRAS
jgi:SM-20-related protein